MAGYTPGLEGRLYDYFKSVAYREPDIPRELREATARLGSDAQMQIGQERGAFMAMLVKLMGARRNRRRSTARRIGKVQSRQCVSGSGGTDRQM